MFRFIVLEENEPFRPIIILSRIPDIPEENPVQPIPEPCLVCKAEIKVGLEIIVSNTSDDEMIVGRCCEHHDHAEVIELAFKELYRLLYKRLELVELIECDKIKVLEINR